MVAPPLAQLVFSTFAWISMAVYLYLFCKLLQSRRNIPQFKSSYYSLFLLQCAADFYVFFVVEIIMRPRKYNYFNLFSENMHLYALFTMANVMISKGVLCSGHIIIALNRLTAFYLPLKQGKIWSSRVIILSVVSLWILSILTSLPALIIYHDAPHFVLKPSGVLQTSNGAIDEYYCYQGFVIGLVTVAVCSVCYLFSYKKARGRKYTMVEQRLFLCAVASAFPFCIEMVRSILMLLTLGSKNELYKTVTSIWYYEMEAIVSTSVWLQLIINKSVRDLIFRKLPLNRQNKIGLNRFSTISAKARGKCNALFY